MPEDQDKVYYLFGQNRASIEAGPFLEAFKARNIEVIYAFEEADEIILRDVAPLKKKLISGDSDEVTLDKLDKPDNEEQLDEDTTKALCEWLKKNWPKR